jgi:hypothetical protein
MSDYTAPNKNNNARPANVPTRQYGEFERIIPVRQPGRPAPAREAIPYINCPGQGQNWSELNEWRAAYGLPLVTR